MTDRDMIDPLTLRVLAERDLRGFWTGVMLAVAGLAGGAVIGWALMGPVGVMAVRYVLL